MTNQSNNDSNSIESLSVKKLFDGDNRYIIPIYQRNYAWDIEEVNQLINDIKNHDGNNYYLGALTVKKRADNAFEVIDGQQRLTTLFLILILCGVLQIGSNGLSFWAFRDGFQNLNQV